MAETSATVFPAGTAIADDRLEDQVYRKLFDKIRFGTYTLGARLPTEAELCEEHGVSRPVVRAALSKLRDSGLVTSRQGAGSFVSSGVPTTAGGYAPLGSIADIATFFQFRRTIEEASVELAARVPNPKGAALLKGYVDEMRELLSSNEPTVHLDIRFHTTIAELSDNRFFCETLEMIRPHWIFVGNFVRSLGATGQRKGRRMTEEHLAIIETIAAGDPSRARKAMAVHIDGSESRVFKGAP